MPPSLYTSGEYAIKNPDWHIEHSPWKAQQVLKMLDRHALQPKRIAEVGCGAGAILESLQKMLHPKPFCLGYDISPQAYELALKRKTECLTFQLGTPRVDDGPFDLVLTMDVLEHVEDYIGFIRDLKPIAPWKILHIPLDLSVVSMAKPVYLQLAREHVGHLHYFTLETALATVEHAGLKVKDWFLTSVELDQGFSGRRRLQMLRRWLYRWNPRFTARWLGGFSVMILAENK